MQILVANHGVSVALHLQPMEHVQFRTREEPGVRGWVGVWVGSLQADHVGTRNVRGTASITAGRIGADTARWARTGLLDFVPVEICPAPLVISVPSICRGNYRQLRCAARRCFSDNKSYVVYISSGIFQPGCIQAACPSRRNVKRVGCLPICSLSV